MSVSTRHSISSKLFWLAARSIGFAVLIAAGTSIWQDVSVLRNMKVQQLQAIAEVLASNCAVAVSFDQRDSAAELLSSLRYRPMVIDAYILDPNGQRFAGYVARGASFIEPVVWPERLPAGFEFTADGHLEVQSPILEDNETLGMLFIHARTDDIMVSLFSHIPTSLAALSVSLIVGLALAFHLQKSITEPILRLTRTAEEIAETGNYKLRVDLHSEQEGEIGYLCEQFNRMVGFVDEANAELNRAHEQVVRTNDALEERVKERTGELAAANDRLKSEIEERKKAHSELQELQEHLVRISRQAGMAELANGVLHNIGNVLNSVNVNTSMLAERIVDMKAASLSRTVHLLESNLDRLGPFFRDDEKGVHLIPFLKKLAEHLESTQEKASSGIAALKKSIHHIETIVQSQQSFAGSYGVIEHCDGTSTFEDAVKFVGGSFERHGITVHRDFDADVPLEVDKGKLLQILVNFIRNAKDALVESGRADKQLALRIVRPAPNQLEFQVTDNGCGLTEEGLQRVFTHGFTTKKHGHGFGLHSAAIAAREIGGAVFVHSDGPGKGAIFSVRVPFNPSPVALGIVAQFAATTIPDAVQLN